MYSRLVSVIINPLRMLEDPPIGVRSGSPEVHTIVLLAMHYPCFTESVAKGPAMCVTQNDMRTHARTVTVCACSVAVGRRRNDTDCWTD